MSEIKRPTHAQGQGRFKRSRRFVQGVCRTSNVLIVCCFVFFFAFVLVSNDFDWDHFLAAAEVDRRSWLLNQEPPLWSYQFCGGITRAGDPQSFGLSPLFLPILMFGSFWGLKLTVLALALIGFFSLRGILQLFLQVKTGIRRPRPVETALIQVVSLSFVLGNYFAWHFHEGHISFAQNYIILGVFYFLTKALFHSFSARDALAAGILSFSFFSGAFYHSIVFFLVPLLFSCCIFAIVFVFARRWTADANPPAWGRIGAALGATCVGLLAAAYKPYFVLAYQRQFPRALHDSPPEPSSVKQWLVYQLVPTLDNKFAGFFRGWGPWGTWEYSSFTINAWICIIGLLLFSYRRTASIRRLLIFAISLIVAGGLFAIGDEASLSLHRLINLAADHSIRVIGRYQIILSLALACLAAALLHASGRLRRWTFAYGSCAIPLLLSLNFLSFRQTLRPDSLWSILSYAREPVQAMNTEVIVERRSPSQSHMYQPILLGGAVLNCYDPIAREAVIAREFRGRAELVNPQTHALQPGLLPFVDPEQANPSERCQRGSYFTQARLVLDGSCAPGTCVNVNALNIYQSSPLKLNSMIGKFCLPPRVTQ